MKFYNYLLFRLHRTLSKHNLYDAKGVDFLTTLISFLFVYITGYTLWSIINFYFFPSIHEINISYGQFVLFFSALGYANFYFFIRKKKFLNYNFKEGKRGGYLIFGYIISVFFIFILIANKNREKIRNENQLINKESIR